MATTHTGDEIERKLIAGKYKSAERIHSFWIRRDRDFKSWCLTYDDDIVLVIRVSEDVDAKPTIVFYDNDRIDATFIT